MFNEISLKSIDLIANTRDILRLEVTKNFNEFC